MLIDIEGKYFLCRVKGLQTVIGFNVRQEWHVMEWGCRVEGKGVVLCTEPMRLPLSHLQAIHGPIICHVDVTHDNVIWISGVIRAKELISL